MSHRVPIKMLFESQGHVVVVETITGDIYHGKLLQAEANMNCEMQYVSVKFKNGQTVEMESIFIRGSKIVFLVLPSVFEEHPAFGGEVPVAPPEPKNKSKRKKFGKGKNPQITPKNVQGTPQGPSILKKKGVKNPQTTPKNVQGTPPQGPSILKRKGGGNPQTPQNVQGTFRGPSTSKIKGG